MEIESLGLVVSADKKFSDLYYHQPPYFLARTYLDYLLQSLNVPKSKIIFTPTNQVEDYLWADEVVKPYQRDRSAVITYEQAIIGVIGEYKKEVKVAFKLSDYTAGFELNVNLIDQLFSKLKPPYRQLSKYPKVVQDLTLSVANDVIYQEVISRLNICLGGLIKKSMRASLSLIDSYRPESSELINWTFRLEISDQESTLTDSMVNELMNKLKTNYFKLS